MANEENAHYEQLLHLQLCFPKLSAADMSVCGKLLHPVLSQIRTEEHEIHHLQF